MAETGQRLAQAEAVELGGQRQLGDAVALVGRDDRSAAASGAAGRPSPRRPGRTPARASTTSTATCASASPARACSRIEPASGSSSCEVHPAGVDQLELAPVPLAVELLAVARDARALVHDRLARAREAVDQRGLAHVRIADDGDLHAGQYDRAGAGRLTDGPSRQARCAARARRCARRPPRRSRPVVSSVTAPGAGRRGLCSRLVVALVAQRLLGQDGRRIGAQLGGAPARALARVGREEDLQLGVRRDDGADVAALGHPVAARRSARAAWPRAPRARPASAATREAASETSGVRIASVTSRPSSSTRAVAPELDRAPRAASSAGSRGRAPRARAGPTQRYIAPLSR